jgi:hypothetical protein
MMAASLRVLSSDMAGPGTPAEVIPKSLDVRQRITGPKSQPAA